MLKELFNIAHKDKGFEMESIPIGDLVNSINKVLSLKQAELQEYGIGIKNVDLTLKTLAIVDSGVNIILQIPILGKIVLGSEISEKSLQTTSLTLTPSRKVKLGRGIELNSMEETISQSIVSIIEGVKVGNIQESVPMELDNASFMFNFIVTGDTRISMIIENGFESELSNTIKINFQKQ